MSISPTSQVIPVARDIGRTASGVTRREFLEPSPTIRATIIPWHHGWPGKQAGGEKGAKVGVTPAARMNHFHPRL